MRSGASGVARLDASFVVSARAARPIVFGPFHYCAFCERAAPDAPETIDDQRRCTGCRYRTIYGGSRGSASLPSHHRLNSQLRTETWRAHISPKSLLPLLPSVQSLLFFCPNNLRCLLFNFLLLSSVLGCDQSVLPEKSKITVKTTAPTSGLVYQHECLTLPWG